MSKETLLWHPPSYSEPLAPGSTTAWHVTYRSPRATLLLRRCWNAHVRARRGAAYSRPKPQIFIPPCGASPTETDRFVAPAAWTPLLSEKGRDSLPCYGRCHRGARGVAPHVGALGRGGRIFCPARASERACSQAQFHQSRSRCLPFHANRPGDLHMDMSRST